MINVYKPYLKNHKKYAIEAINDEWVSNHGKFVNLSENKLKELFNIKYCILTNSGTSATQCLYKSIKFLYPQIKKIYIPNFVFIAAINVGLFEFPNHYFEVLKTSEKSLNIDYSKDYLLSLEKNSAIMIVHNYGNIIDVDYIKSIRPDIILIEDNCEGVFGKYNNKFTGTSNSTLCSSISFYGNKTITSGEGGAFLTNNEKLYEFIKQTCNHGMSNKRYIHNIIGTNYRMTNIEAALLYSQLQDIDNILKLKKSIFNNYDLLLGENINKGIILKTEKNDNTEISYWMYNIIIPGINYDISEKFLKENNIETRPFFYNITNHKYLSLKFQDIENENNVERISNCGIVLPSYPDLTLKQQEYICDKINELIIFCNNK